MRTNNPEQVEELAQYLLRQIYSSRGASFMSADSLFSQAVLQRLRQLMTNDDGLPFVTPT